ncbi:MAG: hypothetical protein M1828_006492 [Chrysothrix sp. TS-e1954]|nr:MAG: hypothetical protein M1828_006492 [Chrysothrix sp. TS-e1954]
MMRFTTSTAAFVLGLVASVAASPAPTSTTDDQYLTPPATFPPLGTASGGALDSTHANNAVPTGNELAVVKKPLTIHVHNKEPEAVSILYHQNAGVPAFNGHPTAGVLKAAHTTKLVAPTGYAGRIIVGKKRYNPAGSKIEPNNVNAQPNVDVSYVDGFTLPIVCSCGGKVVTGCNKPLFELGKCPQADQGPGEYHGA